MARTAIKRITWWHEAIIDYLIANPHVKKVSDVADHFNVSPGWMGQIISSDAFRARLAERRALHAKSISRDVSKKLQEVASLGVDLMLRKLEAIGEELEVAPERVAMKELRETSEMALASLGYGSRKGGVNVNVGVSVVGSDVLQRARARMQALRGAEYDNGDAEALPADTAAPRLPPAPDGRGGEALAPAAGVDSADEGQE